MAYLEILWNNVGWIMLFLTTIYIIWYKKYTNNQYAITSKFQESKEYEVSFPNLLEAISGAMTKAGFHDITVSPKTGAFIGKTKFSMASWMELIEIRCEQTSTGTILKFLSICALPTQIYAWGKNKRNAIRFFKELEKELQLPVR